MYFPPCKPCKGGVAAPSRKCCRRPPNVARTGWSVLESASEQASLRWTVWNAEMFIGQPGSQAAAGRALEKADLKEVGFVDIFDGVDFFAQDRSNCVHADRAASEFL